MQQAAVGRLVGVDLARGTIAWSASTSVGEDDPGFSGYGPALATASGLVFHAETYHPVLRVHDGIGSPLGDYVIASTLP